MDQQARAQIRLILTDADARAKKAVHDRLKTIYADHAAKGTLQSGATLTVALADIEEITSKFITSCVDHVARIAKDVEAFALIRETVEGLLRFLGGRVEDAAAMATGNSRHGDRFEGVLKAAETRFAASRYQLRQQLEIHRFTFTVPYDSLMTASSARAPAAAKSRGGKPLAQHWDEMWAALAVMLYTGDLQPTTQADIERAMKDWLAGHNLYVGDTTVRTRARQLWQKLQDAE